MRRQVVLEISEEGVLPLGSESYGFNHFWEGNGGIHHDVFEHYFEDIHKYFRGNYAYNIGGEIAASGHTLYYVHNGFDRTTVGGDWLTDEIMVKDTLNQIEEAINGGNYFGTTLECAVPNQKPGPEEVECMIELYLDRLSTVLRRARALKNAEFSETYANSCHPSKIRNLLRWGYKEASKIAPNTYPVRHTMNDFFSFWNNFCKEHRPEDVHKWYDRLIVKYNPGQNFEWKAYFRDKYERKLINVERAEIFDY